MGRRGRSRFRSHRSGHWFDSVATRGCTSRSASSDAQVRRASCTDLGRVSIDVPHGDAAGPDSLGLFQQRDSWGPAPDRLDPGKSAKIFYAHLIAIPDRDALPPTVAAQSVQRSWANEDPHLHDLRHTGGTLAAGTPGANVRDLMARLGHSSPRAALIYLHTDSERDRMMAETLNMPISGIDGLNTP